VLVGGEAVRACLMLAVQANGLSLETIEGEAEGPGELSVLQEAFCQCHGLQCGYCTSGMILTARALLNRNPTPDRDEIVDAIAGNLCRCTGYLQIVEAIELAASELTQARRKDGSGR
jgi:carbon-monoxide dehydrogenase small subunit